MVFTLSATAPQFLPEQETTERSSLSQEEIDQIQQDLYGIVKFQETPLAKETGLEHLGRALDAIKDLDKRAYVEAR